MRGFGLTLGILLLPLLPGVAALAWAQPVDASAASDPLTQWLVAVLTTVGTPAALTGALVLGARYACLAVMTGHPVEFRFRIDKREVFFQLVEIDPTTPPTPVGDDGEDSEDSDPEPAAVAA